MGDGVWCSPWHSRSKRGAPTPALTRRLTAATVYVCGRRSGCSRSRHSPPPMSCIAPARAFHGTLSCSTSVVSVSPWSSSAVTTSPRPWFHSSPRWCSNVDVGVDVRARRRTRRSARVARSTGARRRAGRRVRDRRSPTASGWPSRMNSRPPGRRRPATTPAQRSMLGQPVDRADAGVDEVERRGRQHVERVVHLGLDELDVGTGRGGQPPGLVERGGGEVEAGHAAPRAGRARRCRCRCGTAGGRRAARRPTRAAGGRRRRRR